MAKYTFEFKKQIVLEYLSGEGSSNFLAKKYGVPDGKNVRNWINYYKEFGDDGLRRSRKNKNYSFEFKLHVVELYISSEVSYQDLAISLGISNQAMIARWVNDFRIAGPNALRPKKKGRKKTLDSEKKIKTEVNSTQTTQVDTSAEHVKELEERILDIRKEHKDFGYRRVLAMLKKEGIIINKKKVQRIMQKLGLQVTSYTRKSRRYNSYKGKVGRIVPNRINRRFHTSIPHQKKLPIQQNLSIMNLMKKEEWLSKNCIWIHS